MYWKCHVDPNTPGFPCSLAALWLKGLTVSPSPVHFSIQTEGFQRFSESDTTKSTTLSVQLKFKHIHSIKRGNVEYIFTNSVKRAVVVNNLDLFQSTCEYDARDGEQQQENILHTVTPPRPSWTIHMRQDGSVLSVLTLPPECRSRDSSDQATFFSLLLSNCSPSASRFDVLCI